VLIDFSKLYDGEKRSSISARRNADDARRDLMYTSLTRRSFLIVSSLASAARLFLFADILQKTIDKRNSSEQGEYAIGFAAKASDGGFDHAFVVWYYSDPKGVRTVRRCAGFYPVADDDTKSYDMILGVSGRVFDDSKTKVSQELTVLVNADVFGEAIKVEDRYQNDHTYRLAFDDCTTFVIKVAASIPGLTIPSRLTDIYPSSFITGLYDANTTK
jgi:hypothetical protein